ncbi:unnamed protein product [Somion occarium]|uniref:Uncharacterized protein n=1 Tax=Somion occarium TaxID=3059160 RepID=A0ABP1CJQ9_9APHY
MLSVLRTAAPAQQPLTEPSPKAKFKTVLGLGANTKENDTAAVQRPSALGRTHPSLSRRSVDTITDWQVKQKKSKADRPSTPDIAFFEQDVVTVSKPNDVPDNEMKNGVAPRAVPQRRPFRVDGQDGHWTISVAETPHDASSYSLYVKTPTHNLTLTRTALEIIEMNGKLRDSHPSVKLPALPIDASSVPTPPPKRKSAFLNTLSRLASPSSKAASRQASSSKPSPASSSQGPANGTASSGTTPIASPAQEINDPFTSFPDGRPIGSSAEPGLPPSNSTITRLAAYLTHIANDATLRQSRTWKRFVRVRTDDLQSVRAERAIKRVRSDLAAHSSSSSPDVPRSMAQVMNEDAERATAVNSETAQDQELPSESTVASSANSINGERASVLQDSQDVKEEEDLATERVEVNNEVVQSQAQPAESKPSSPIVRNGQVANTLTNGVADLEEDTNEPSTPVADDASVLHANRIPRSQSADPMSRGSRIIYSPSSGMSSPLRDGTSSQTSATGDDSSISTTGRRSTRKKRSKSTDPKKSKRKVVIDDFEMMRVLGKGCAGKVLLVRHKPTQDVFALKAITKRHVLAHQELQHTLTEQAVLKRMAAEGTDPFVVKLWWSFHDKENLFLDFHPGGDLATQLARWGRLGRDRARFYAAEIVEGVEGLHAAGVIYRDLKPENILIGADGHIVLTDFGLSKEFPRRTAAFTAPPTPSGSGHRSDYLDGSPVAASAPWMREGWTGANDMTSTFCGTAEYLAPEVIQGLPYSYEVDWWSFGTMLYEMLTGITPFWANNHSDMYYRVLQDELQFPEDRTMDQDTKSLIRGLLQRNPALRMKEPRIKKHPYFSMIDWSHVYYKRYIPPYIPPIDPSNASDTQNFDDTFLDMEPVIKDEHENDQTDTDGDRQTDAERTDGEDSVATPSQSRSPSVHPIQDDSVDVFDGYSFKGRHSIILDGDDEDGEADDSEREEDEEASLAAPSLDNLLPQEPVTEDEIPPVSDITTVEEVPEPKTPEARPTVLPDTDELSVPEVTTPVDHRPQVVEPQAVEEVTTTTAEPSSPVVEATPATEAPAEIQIAPAEPKPHVESVKVAIPRPPPRHPRSRREKSGIPALDRNLSDAIDEDGVITEREEEDDWDFVEAGVDEERNGAKGTSLFARGVVDRYRLAVFRKSTPRRSGGRNVSGISGLSLDSEYTEPSDSPTPSDKRRGRTPGLTFRRHPKQFLRPKSPPPSSRSKSLMHSTSATLTTSTSSSAGVLTPSQSGTTSDMSPSLKSKESAISMGTPSESSDASVNGDLRNGGDTIKATPVIPEEEKQKSKGLKKYKEGAEKVLSIFQSPR